MIAIRNIYPAQWRIFKSLSLSALSEAPYAFSETVAEAEAKDDIDWQEMTRRKSTGTDEVCALAFDHLRPVGMAGGLHDDICPEIACLIGMWVDSGYRGTNVAMSLVSWIAKWAESRGARALVAGVVKGNSRAAAFYQKAGFTPADHLRIISMGIDGCEHIFAKDLKKRKDM